MLGAGPFGGGGVGSATDCTIGITVATTTPNILVNTAASPGNTTGLVTSTAGPATSYESIDDVLVGVVNTTPGVITAITITGAGIFGFDGDGIDEYAGIAANASDMSCTTQGPGPSYYGGPAGFFTNINATQSVGTVNFIGGLTPGASTYFSLELPISGGFCTDPTQCHIGPVPEPATLALFGAGLLGLVGLRLHRRQG